MAKARTQETGCMYDHARAIDTVFHQAANHATYNVGGFNEWKNIDLVKLLIKLMDENWAGPAGTSEALITYVKDINLA